MLWISTENDLAGMDISLIEDMTISGEIKLPQGVAPEGGIEVTVTATDESEFRIMHKNN